MLRRLTIVFVCVGSCLSVEAQNASNFGTAIEGQLAVGLLDKMPQILQRADIAKLRHEYIKVKEEGGKTATYSGVPVKDLLEYAGASFGSYRAELGAVVVAEQVDGPSVVFALAELDYRITHKRVLLADSKDGKPLRSSEGTFRIVVSDERESIRWAKQVWAVYVVEFSDHSASQRLSDRRLAE